MIRLIIVDDDTIIREGLKMILETQEDIIIVAVCSNGEEAIQVCQKEKPEVALLDIRMPGMSGIEVVKILIQENLARPLLLTTFDEPDLILQAVKINVSGYILKSSPAKTILSAIRTVALGGTVFEKEVIQFIFSHFNGKFVEKSVFEELTERELDVASLIAQGLSNKEIGAQNSDCNQFFKSKKLDVTKNTYFNSKIVKSRITMLVNENRKNM